MAEEKMGPAEKVIFWYTEKPYEGGGLSRVYCMLQLSIKRETSATGKATNRVRVLFTFVAGRGGRDGGHGARRRLVGRRLRPVDHHHDRRWLAAVRVVAVPPSTVDGGGGRGGSVIGG